MERRANDDPTLRNAQPAEQTNVVEVGQVSVWRKAAALVAAAALFSTAFLGAYLLGRGSPAPAAPPQSTWHGTAVPTVPEASPNPVNPISAAAGLPQLHVTTNGSLVGSVRHSPVSGTTNQQTTKPQTKPVQKPKVTANDGLITVTN